MKTCRTCLATKLEADFYRHPTTRDGYFTRCAECVRNHVNPYQRERYHANKGSSVERKATIERNQDRKRERAAELAARKRLAHCTRYGTE